MENMVLLSRRSGIIATMGAVVAVGATGLFNRSERTGIPAQGPSGTHGVASSRTPGPVASPPSATTPSLPTPPPPDRAACAACAIAIEVDGAGRPAIDSA